MSNSDQPVPSGPSLLTVAKGVVVGVVVIALLRVAMWVVSAAVSVIGTILIALVLVGAVWLGWNLFFRGDPE